MSLAKIQSEIAALDAADYSALRQWFAERDWDAWDREFEEDVESGRLDFLAAEAKVARQKGQLLDL